MTLHCFHALSEVTSSYIVKISWCFWWIKFRHVEVVSESIMVWVVNVQFTPYIMYTYTHMHRVYWCVSSLCCLCFRPEEQMHTLRRKSSRARQTIDSA